MTTNLGPVSKTLEADVREWVRKHGIVVWLNLDDHYSGFIDRLMLLRKQGELPYEVRAYIAEATWSCYSPWNRWKAVRRKHRLSFTFRDSTKIRFARPPYWSSTPLECVTGRRSTR